MKGMLLSVVWRNVRDEWRMEMHEKSKLSMMKWITKCEVKSSSAFLKLKAKRRMMLKLRDGTAAFQIEHYINCSIDAVFVLCSYMPQCCPIGFKIIDNSIILTVTFITGCGRLRTRPWKE